MDKQKKQIAYSLIIIFVLIVYALVYLLSARTGIFCCGIGCFTNIMDSSSYGCLIDMIIFILGLIALVISAFYLKKACINDILK